MRRTFLGLFTFLAAACSSGGQGNPAPATPAPTGAAPSTAASCPLERGTMVLNTSFSNSGERAALTLQAGCLYWATTDVSGIQLQLRPRVTGTQRPYVGSLMGGGGVTGGQTWEIRATNTGEFEIWATGAPAGRAVKLEVTVRGSLKS